jgi:hypothetical protein
LLARVYVLFEAVKTVLTANPPDGYIAFQGGLVSKAKLAQNQQTTRRNTCPNQEKMPLTEATKIIEDQG